MTTEDRMDHCARAAVAVDRAEYDRQGHSAVISWHVARSRAADNGLCPVPEQEDRYSLDAVSRMRSRFADLAQLEAQLQGIRVTAYCALG